MADSVNIHHHGTRVLKKCSPNGKMTVYLGKRDFVDHISHVDPIDGVVLIDPDYMQDRKLFVQVHASFVYDRQDLNVLGVTLQKNLHFEAKQIYPVPWSGRPDKHTQLQRRLMKKLGRNAYPFYFELPANCPASVALRSDAAKPCGVDYELKAFVAQSLEDKPRSGSVARLAIRKITYCPPNQLIQPSVEVNKSFVLSQGKLHLEASLDKQVYHHGEFVAVNVHVANNSNRTVKKIKIAIKQLAHIRLFSTTSYKSIVAETKCYTEVAPGFTLSKVFFLKPMLTDGKGQPAVALDGQLKHEDTNLASSTVITDPAQRDNHGIIVQYKVKVKLCLGALGGELEAELSFKLMHPKPEQKETTRRSRRQTENPAEDENLIELEETIDGDDLIFEDFARCRLAAGR